MDFKSNQLLLCILTSMLELVLYSFRFLSYSFSAVNNYDLKSQSDDPSQKSAQTVTKLLPLMIGWFALSVPSGLSLYW